MQSNNNSRNRSLKDEVYDELKDRLIHCIYEPGSFVNEKQLADDLGTSRTPIREAISRLEHEDLVQVISKKGIYIKNITMHDVQQIFDTRRRIEPITLLMSANSLPKDMLYQFRKKFQEDVADIRSGYKLDTAMHLFLIEYCGNRYLIDMMQKVFEDNTRVIISSKQNQVKIHDARQEHLEIIEELIAGHYQEASDLMGKHIDGCREAAMNYFIHMDTGYVKNGGDTATYISYLTTI